MVTIRLPGNDSILGIPPEHIMTRRAVGYCHDWLQGDPKAFERARLAGFEVDGTIPRTGEIAAGTTLRVDWFPRELVSRWIAHGWADPAFAEETWELERFQAEVRSDEMSLGEAYRLQVGGYPKVADLLAATGQHLSLGRLYVKDYKNRPSWVPEFGRQQAQAPRRISRSPMLQDEAEEPVRRPPPKRGSVREFNGESLKYVLHGARWNFLRLLADGDLVSQGYSKGMPAAKPITIPAVVWGDRDVIIDLAKGKILQREEGRGRRPRCLYKEVTVRPADQDAAPSTIGDEVRCERWLGGLVAEGPQQTPKRHYEAEAMKRFPCLSRRGFERAWANSTRNAADWGRPGRPG